jgi:hypothetical protein
MDAEGAKLGQGAYLIANGIPGKACRRAPEVFNAPFCDLDRFQLVRRAHARNDDLREARNAAIVHLDKNVRRTQLREAYGIQQEGLIPFNIHDDDRALAFPQFL